MFRSLASIQPARFRPAISRLRTTRGGGKSTPPYPFSHTGPVLVAGNALCLHDDLKRAREIFPDAGVIAVNGAAKEVRAFAIFSRHPEHMISHGWLRKQRFKFGDDFTVHGSRFVEGQDHVQYWWDGARGGGGSAWGARKMAWLMGFDQVILCGCPLDPGPYVGNHNLGGFMADENVVEDLRAGIEAEPEWFDGVVSMGGFTESILGAPK